MEISVRQTNLKPSLIKTLIANGIVLVTHLNAFDVTRLAAKIRMPMDDCEAILAATKPKRPYQILKASEIVLRPFQKFSTLIPDLDELLDGGIKCGQLTEISGEAAAGKSNLCSMIGSRVMDDNRVIFIHTEGEGKLKLAIKRFQSIRNSIENLRVLNCHNEFELLEAVNRLTDHLTGVKLVIIDSITNAFISTDSPDYEKRSLRLTKMVKVLANLAWEQRIAILTTNHVAYNFKDGQNRPAMGKLWSHMCQTKIFLERIDKGHGTTRFAHVTKGASKCPHPVRYRID